jgi:hypothetical protein
MRIFESVLSAATQASGQTLEQGPHAR